MTKISVCAAQAKFMGLRALLRRKSGVLRNPSPLGYVKAALLEHCSDLNVVSHAQSLAAVAEFFC